jgi:ABC-type amino acid transport system permease subunit
MATTLHFHVSDGAGMYSFGCECAYDILCIVNGVNNTVAVSVVGFIQCTALKPVTGIGRLHSGMNNIVHDSVGIRIFGAHIRPAPPECT